MPADIRSALVVGGGIGGLTVATALSRKGWNVEVVELKDNWDVAGWGLSVTGPALRALAELGLAQDCIDSGYGINTLTHRGLNGEVLHQETFPSLLGPGQPSQAGMARPELARILRTAAVASGATLHTSLTVTDVSETEDSITATLSDGTQRTVDLIVAADGVHSRMRALIGRTEKPSYTGQMVWRAMVRRPEWGTGVNTLSGAKHNAGLIPISQTHAYCFVTENTDDSSALPDEVLADRMRSLLEPFGGILTEVREQITDPATVVRRPAQTISSIRRGTTDASPCWATLSMRPPPS